MANSVDPDQTPRSAASDLGLQRSMCPNSKWYKYLTFQANCFICQTCFLGEKGRQQSMLCVKY